MRVLLTIHDFLPAARAGSELYTLYLAQGLQRVGHEVHVFHGEAGEEFAVAEREYEGLPCTVVVKPIPPWRALPRELRDEIDAAFAELLARFDPQVVHVNHLLGLSMGIPRLCAERGVPVVFTLHDYWLACLRSTLQQPDEQLCDGPAPDKCALCCQARYARWPVWDGNGTLRGAVTRQAKEVLNALFDRAYGPHWFKARDRRVAEVVENTGLFVAPSRFLLETMVRAGFPRSKMVYSDYGMAAELFPGRAERRREGGRLRFGYVGTISRHKGVHVLLKAFENFTEAELHIYGSRDDSVLAPFAAVLRQENVRFHGRLLDEGKAEAFGAMDALIVPSVWYENSPLTIHEAYLAGVPVVTSNAGGMAELVPDGVSGIQFELGNADDLRGALARLCRSPETLAKLRQNIPPVKSMEEHVPEVVGFYDRVLAAGPVPLP
jgi:glycosyltransferase involved in cell wall biosynthesis